MDGGFGAMSWSVNVRGTKSELAACLDDKFDQVASMYPKGTLEGDDIEVARARVKAVVAALDVRPHSFWDGELIQVACNGSHSWGDMGKEEPSSSSFSVSVARVVAPQKP